MNHLTRSLLITGILGLAATASAADYPHHNAKHWDIGLQGGLGWGSLDTQSSYYEYTSSYDQQELHDGTYKKAVGLFGAHLGYEYMDGNNSWELAFAAQAGFGNVAGEHYVNLAADSDAASINESVKPKHVYDLKLNWKHFIYSDMYFTFGMGASRLEAENTLSIYANDVTDADVHQIVQGQTLHATGLVVSMGMGYLLTDDSSFDMGLSFYNYGSRSLERSPQIDAADGGDTPEYLQNRKNQLSMVALTVGYSHYF